MRNEILSNLDNPGQLEKLYRADKQSFKREFKTLYPNLADNALAGFWHERLNFNSGEASKGDGRGWTMVIMASLLAGLIAKLPAILSLNEEFFYSRNVGFILFPILSAYFGWKNRLSIGKIAFLVLAMLTGLLFINFLPDAKRSDTLILSCIHLVLFLGSMVGFAFVGGAENVIPKRLDFLKYIGDLVVMTTLILIAGVIMTALTINLFRLIGFNIEELYFNYVGVFGLAAAPIVGTYLTQTNPGLVGKVSPVIARIFSPLVLVMLVGYLWAIAYSRKDPFNDREFLLIFNGLLVGVMAIIFFSIAGNANTNKSKLEIWILFLLSVVTVAVNSVALSAISFRISEWGLTPNRLAVLGGNILILINLLLVVAQFFKVVTKKTTLHGVSRVMSFYLPIYVIWSVIVTFLFPFLFGFK